MQPSTSSASAEPSDPRLRRRLGRHAWFTALVAVGIGALLPVAGRLLDLVSLDGMPLGFYVAAQGAPVLMAALLGAFAWCARRIEKRAAIDDGSGHSGQH